MKSIFIPVDYYYPAFRFGGPIASLKRIVDYIDNYYLVCLMTRAFDRDASSLYPLSVPSNVWRANNAHSLYYARNLYIVRILLHLFSRQYDIIYLNSFFSPTSILFYFLSLFCFFSNTTILIAPRGELTSGALSVKQRKKLFLLFFFIKFVPYTTFYWHASNFLESYEIQKFIPSLSKRIFISTDPVSLPILAPLLSCQTNTSPTLVYASRITPKKNLAFIVKVISALTINCKLKIYGSIDDNAYWSQCLLHLQNLPHNVLWEYLGEYNPVDIPNIFQSSDLFLFPTLSENFGHVIFESLSYGCPVLLSPYTPWNSIPPALTVLSISSCELWTSTIESFFSIGSDPSVVRYKCIEYSKIYYASCKQGDQLLNMFNSI